MSGHRLGLLQPWREESLLSLQKTQSTLTQLLERGLCCWTSLSLFVTCKTCPGPFPIFISSSREQAMSPQLLSFSSPRCAAIIAGVWEEFSLLVYAFGSTNPQTTLPWIPLFSSTETWPHAQKRGHNVPRRQQGHLRLVEGSLAFSMMPTCRR